MEGISRNIGTLLSITYSILLLDLDTAGAVAHFLSPYSNIFNNLQLL